MSKAGLAQAILDFGRNCAAVAGYQGYCNRALVTRQGYADPAGNFPAKPVERNGQDFSRGKGWNRVARACHLGRTHEETRAAHAIKSGKETEIITTGIGWPGKRLQRSEADNCIARLKALSLAASRNSHQVRQLAAGDFVNRAWSNEIARRATAVCVCLDDNSADPGLDAGIKDGMVGGLCPPLCQRCTCKDQHGCNHDCMNKAVMTLGHGKGQRNCSRSQQHGKKRFGLRPEISGYSQRQQDRNKIEQSARLTLKQPFLRQSLPAMLHSVGKADRQSCAQTRPINGNACLADRQRIRPIFVGDLQQIAISRSIWRCTSRNIRLVACHVADLPQTSRLCRTKHCPNPCLTRQTCYTTVEQAVGA